jgi:predicted permease
MRRFFARLHAFLRPGRADRDLAREVAAHLALIEDDLRARCWTEAAARAEARRVYGGVDVAMEAHRDARSFIPLEQFAQDIRHALRSLRKSPAFVAVALLSLAFGIGVNTAIFTLVHGVLLRRLPVPDPHRIVQIRGHLKTSEAPFFSFPHFLQFDAQSAVFSDVIAFSEESVPVEFGETRVPVKTEFVTGRYFGFFRARPELGRLLDEEDDRIEGARPVVVISHVFWQSRFGGDPSVVGRTIRFGGADVQVAGVAPDSFAGADLQRRNEVWAPTAMAPNITRRQRRDNATWYWLGILARLKPGVSFAEASARLQAISPQIEANLPANRANKGAEYRIIPAETGFDRWRTALREPLMLLMGAVTLVLLVACANLANLLLARAGERRQEYAIKLSLGITRARLLRQFLLETFAVTLAGGALGVAVAVGLTRYLLVLFNSGNRFLTLDVAPDSSVLLYTLAGCVATAFAAGIYPAWQASRTDVARGLASGALTIRRAFARRALILAQVTLAVILVFGSSLFGHSLRKLKTVDLGVDIDRVLTMQVRDNSADRVARAVTGSPRLAAVLDRVRQLPGVESAAWSSPAPLDGAEMSTDLEIDGRKLENVRMMFGSPGFLATLRLPLLRGRDFTAADRENAPGVALINQRLADLAWPGENPIGRTINGWSHKVEIVGVVGNSRYGNVREDWGPVAYEPFDQQRVSGGVLLVRARGSLAAVERDARAVVKVHGTGYVVNRVAAMTLLRDGGISRDRLLAFLSSVFGGLGAALALVGIYGLIAYSVTRRTREVGVRISVGAQRRDVLWLFLRESVALIAAGIVLGLPLAIVLARFVRKMLYQVSPDDPAGIALTIGVMAAGGLLAAWLPGRAATRIDPVRALRYD